MRVALSLLVGGLYSLQAASFWITTGQTGAQVQLDLNHPQTWQITPTAHWDLGGGRFEMKDGPNTSADIWLSIWVGDPTSGGIELTDYRRIMQHGTFCGQLANPNTCNNYQTHEIAFALAVPLLPSITYYVQLVSQSAPDRQSEAYFIKSGNGFLIRDDNNQPPPITDVPEPTSAAAVAIGLLLVFGAASALRARHHLT